MIDFKVFLTLTVKHRIVAITAEAAPRAVKTIPTIMLTSVMAIKIYFLKLNQLSKLNDTQKSNMTTWIPQFTFKTQNYITCKNKVLN